MYVRPANATQVKVQVKKLRAVYLNQNIFYIFQDFSHFQVIKSETTLTANVRLWFDRNRIVGNASIENLDFKLIESKIDNVDQAVFGDLGLFGAEFLEKLLTEILKMGLVIPTMRGVVLKSPKQVFQWLKLWGLKHETLT